MGRVLSCFSAGRTLLIGHVERFNPVILELEHMLDGPIHVDMARVGRYSPRVGDNVVLDLMVHDLDIACAIFEDYSPNVSAIGQSVVTEEVDIVTATLTFDSGSTAALTASRLGQHKIRRLEVTQLEGFIAADLLRQTIVIQPATRADQVSAGGYRQESVIEVPYLRHQGEPLYLEQTHFVDCVMSGSEPKITATQGRQVLELALKVGADITRAT